MVYPEVQTLCFFIQNAPQEKLQHLKVPRGVPEEFLGYAPYPHSRFVACSLRCGL